MRVSGILLFFAIILPGVAKDFAFKKGDRVAMVGSSAHVLSMDGQFEAQIQQAYPKLGLTFRTFTRPGDLLTEISRPADTSWTRHLAEFEPTVVLFAFGLDEVSLDLDRDTLTQAALGRSRELKQIAQRARWLVGSAVEDGEMRHALRSVLKSTNGVELDLVGFEDPKVLSRKLGGVLGGSFQTPPPQLLEAVQSKNQVFTDILASRNQRYESGPYRGAFGNESFPPERRRAETWLSHYEACVASLAKGERPPTPSGNLLRTLKPPTSNVSVHQAYLPPERLAPQFELLDGFKLQCFASEIEFPDLRNPVRIDFDGQGRAWVLTAPDYPHPVPGEKASGALLVFEDIDRDGRADRQTRFASGFAVPKALAVFGSGAYVGDAPHLYWLPDVDRDLRADGRRPVLSGFGVGDTSTSLSGGEWSPDGGLHLVEGSGNITSIASRGRHILARRGGVYRFFPNSGGLRHVVQPPVRNLWAQSFDRWGRHVALDAYSGSVLDLSCLSRQTSSGLASLFPAGAGVLNSPRRIRPGSAMTFVQSANFPPSMAGNLLVAGCSGFQGIRSYEVHAEGSGLRLGGTTDLLRSTDPNFRPVHLRFAPDGTLFVVDWHNAVIGHPQHSLRDPVRDRSHGRIWRVQATRSLSPFQPLSNLSVAALLEKLLNPTTPQRELLRRELWAREKDEVERQVATRKPRAEESLLEILWLRVALGFDVPSEILTRLGTAREPLIRAATARACGRLPERKAARDQLTSLARDSSPEVRAQVVLATRSFEDVLAVWRQPYDPALEAAIRVACADMEPDWKRLLAEKKLLPSDPQAVKFLLPLLDKAEQKRFGFGRL